MLRAPRVLGCALRASLATPWPPSHAADTPVHLAAAANPSASRPGSSRLRARTSTVSGPGSAPILPSARVPGARVSPRRVSPSASCCFICSLAVPAAPRGGKRRRDRFRSQGRPRRPAEGGGVPAWPRCRVQRPCHQACSISRAARGGFGYEHRRGCLESGSLRSGHGQRHAWPVRDITGVHPGRVRVFSVAVLRTARLRFSARFAPVPTMSNPVMHAMVRH